MPELFTVTDYDRRFYAEHLRDFLPERMIDFHSHVYLRSLLSSRAEEESRSTSWPLLVAADDSIEDLTETYRLMFPDKQVTPLIFSNLNRTDDIDALNDYTAASSKAAHCHALLFTTPDWTAQELETRLRGGGFYGIKPYLDMAPPHIPVDDIHIFDFLPEKHLEVVDRLGMICVLHIPRAMRLRDPENLRQILEIRERFSNVRLDIAHVGRAYTESDVGDAFEILRPAFGRGMYFDISANSNSAVFLRLIDAVGPEHILFGSDMPILRLRTRRITEGGTYINTVPPGMYGDLSAESHMREVTPDEAKCITFFMYEEIKAFRDAADEYGLSTADVEKVFYGNAKSIFDGITVL